MRRVVLASCALVFLLGACEMRADLSIENDGSGTFGFSFGVEEALAGMLRESGGDSPLGGLEAGLRDGPVDWTVTEFRERGLTGFRASFRFASIEDFRRKMDLLSEAQGSAPFESDFVLDRAGDGWMIRGGSGAGSATNLFGGDALGASPFGDGGTPEDLDRLLRMEMRVTLPGKPESTNADEVTQRAGRTTFIWRPKASDPTTSMQARTVGVTAGLLGVRTAAVALLLLAVVAAALYLLKRGRRGPPPVLLEGVLTPAPFGAQAQADADDAQPPAASATG